jgi:hypothetical protein
VNQKHVCTACGHIDAVLEPIMRDGFYVDPRFGIAVGDVSFPLQKMDRIMAHALAWSDYPVSAAALTTRTGSDAEEKAMQHRVSKLRTQFKRAGIISPIIPIPGEGYQWVSPEIAADYGKQKGWFGSAAHRARVTKEEKC